EANRRGHAVTGSVTQERVTFEDLGGLFGDDVDHAAEGVWSDQRRCVALVDLQLGQIAGQKAIEIYEAVVRNGDRNPVEVKRHLAARGEAPNHDARLVSVGGDVLNLHSREVVERLRDVQEVVLLDFRAIDAVRHQRGRRTRSRHGDSDVPQVK